MSVTDIRSLHLPRGIRCDILVENARKKGNDRMTTVEFFDRTPIENIVSALTVVPDKIIFIGEQETMQENRYAYDGFFAQRGLDTKLEFREIKKNDLNDIVRVLTQIVEREDDCIFV